MSILAGVLADPERIVAGGTMIGGVATLFTIVWRYQRTFVGSAAERIAALEKDQRRAEHQRTVLIEALYAAGIPVPASYYLDVP